MNSTDVKRKNKNTLLAIILLAAVVVVFGVYFGIMGHKSGPVDVSELKIDGTILKEPGMSPTFNLTDNNGQAVNEEIFKGRWNLVFFGFTNCGYVCPTSLAALKQMYEQLDKQLPAEKMPQVIMVSVDPARDSYQRMGDYVHSFNSHFIGLRGDDGATDAIKKQMNIRITFMKLPFSTMQYCGYMPLYYSPHSYFSCMSRAFL